ncbi:hypothetical protein Droror1_Dr00016962 [Drosera rotundifolia]
MELENLEGKEFWQLLEERQTSQAREAMKTNTTTAVDATSTNTPVKLRPVKSPYAFIAAITPRYILTRFPATVSESAIRRPRRRTDPLLIYSLSPMKKLNKFGSDCVVEL